MNKESDKPGESQMDADLYLKEYHIQNILTEMVKNLLNKRSKKPIIEMIQYLGGLLTEKEREQEKIIIPPPENNLKMELAEAEETIEKQKSIIKELENKLNIYNTTTNNLNNDINNYKNIISKKDTELNNLKSQLNNKMNKNFNFDDIMVVNFISSEQNVHYAAKCLKTNTFAEVEENLYKEYPQYRETNNYFTANGQQVLRFKTIAENKIGNGFPVILNLPD